jgi:transglutaminase-like putative cysteine protease
MILDRLLGGLRWLYARIGGLTLIRLSLLLLTLYSIARGLAVLVERLKPDDMVRTALLAVLIGWLLARTRLRGGWVLLLGCLAGLLWLALSVGLLGVPLGDLFASLPPILRQLLQRLPPNWQPLAAAWSALGQTTSALLIRLTLWTRSLTTGTLVIDPVTTNLVWAAGLWLSGAWAAWWVRRRANIPVALLPGTALLAYTLYYSNSRSGLVWLTAVGGGWLLLFAAQRYLQLRRTWLDRRLDRTEIEPTLAGVLTLLALVAMLGGGLLPSVSIRQVVDAIQEIRRGNADDLLARSLGLEQTPVGGGEGARSSVGQSATHLIGPGPQLSQAVVFFVSVEDYVPPPPPETFGYADAIESPLRFYWRLQTYNRYNGHIWSNYTGPGQEYPADALLHAEIAGLPGTQVLVVQRIERVDPLDGALLFAGDLLSVDQPITATWRATGDLAYATSPAEDYAARSRLPFVSVTDLRQAGTDYPASIRNLYLDLPENLPPRVQDLALQLTLAQTNPYDRALALQEYLRQFPYSLDVPAPPYDREVADYFLFDLKTGYCDYFATTMALLARAAGIPSRLVTGYTSGSYDYSADRFVVREFNAHAWVEIYLPGIGWVEFEPTPSQPRFPRPGETPLTSPDLGDLPLPGESTATEAPGLGTLLRRLLPPAGVLLGLLLLLAVLPLRDWLLFLQPEPRALQTAFRRLYRAGPRWGIPPDAARTPREYSRLLAERLSRLQPDPKLALSVGLLLADLAWLTERYQRLLFGPAPASVPQGKQAAGVWYRLHARLRRLQRR